MHHLSFYGQGKLLYTTVHVIYSFYLETNFNAAKRMLRIIRRPKMSDAVKNSKHPRLAKVVLSFNDFLAHSVAIQWLSFPFLTTSRR